jgi:hypothetical protein
MDISSSLSNFGMYILFVNVIICKNSHEDTKAQRDLYFVSSCLRGYFLLCPL